MLERNIVNGLTSLIITLLVLCISTSLKGQNSSIEGQIVQKKSGVTIPGINVIINNQQNGEQSGTFTDDEGRFVFDELSAGTYNLKATGIGFEAVSRIVNISTGESASLTLRMETATSKLSEIVVRDTYIGRKDPTTVQRLSPEKIDRQDAATFADVARQLPAAHVATNSRGQTVLYFRNSSDRQIAQFFNGALVNVPWDNRVDIGVLPSSVISNATVSKGTPSVKYGTNTIGGAVNFSAPTLTQPGNITEINLAGGVPESGRGSVLHKGRSGNFSYTAEAGVAARGDFALPDNANLPFSQPSDDTRLNTDRRLFNAFLQGTYEFNSGARLGTSLFHVDAQKGVAPESNLDPTQTGVRFWRYPDQKHSMVILNGQIPVANGSSLRGAVWGSRFSQDIFQYQSIAYQQLDETQEDFDYTGGARLIYDQQLGTGALTLSLNGLTSRHDQTIVPFSNGNAGTDSSSTFRQHIYAIGAEYQFPISDKVEALAGISYEGSAIVDTGPFEAAGFNNYINGTIGLSAGLNFTATDRLTLRTKVGRRPRFPTMRELFGGALGKFIPNPNLQPVTSYSSELGAEWRSAAFTGQLTGFLSRTYDAIDQTTIQNGPNAGQERRINLGGTRIWGVEAVASLSPVNNLSLDGHFTWTQLRGFLDGDTRKLEEKPSLLGVFTAEYNFVNGIKVLAQTEYLGGVFARTEQNTFSKLPDALIFNTRFAYTLSNGFLNGGEIFARVNNLTDELRLLQLGLPGPGREYLAGLKFTF